MNWRLPGTILSIDRADAPFIEKQFSSMFLGGGIVLSQVAGITGLEPYTIQNWVKRGFLPPPDHKRYDLNQLCRIININLLKRTLLMEQICGLLGYINGPLDDASDDIIDDSQLYFLFVKLAATAPSLRDTDEADASIDSLLQDYQEPFPGAKERVAKVMKVMLVAWVASKLHEAAEKMVAAL